MILVTRRRSHPATIAYIERRIQEGKTRREATRCLKRYLARNLYRLLEHPCLVVKKGSKMCGRTSSAMPGPSSVTESVT